MHVMNEISGKFIIFQHDVALDTECTCNPEWIVWISG